MDNIENVMFMAKSLGVALGVFIGICFFIGVLSGSTEIKPISIPDKFDIGYISAPSNAYHYTVYGDDNSLKSEQEEIKRLRNKVQKIKLERQLAQELEIERLVSECKKPEQKTQPQKNPVSSTQKTKHPMLDECISALVSLGEKKQSAVKAATDFLNKNPNTKTVDEFIIGIYKK